MQHHIVTFTLPDSEEEEEFGQDLRGEFPSGGTHFTGDFFGDDYADNDFGYISDDGDHSDSDSDDLLGGDLVAASHAQDEEGWEPVRNPVPANDYQEMEDVQPPVQERVTPSRENNRRRQISSATRC